MPNDALSNNSANNDGEMTKLNGFELNSNKSSNGIEDVACQNDAITKAIEVTVNRAFAHTTMVSLNDVALKSSRFN